MQITSMELNCQRAQCYNDVAVVKLPEAGAGGGDNAINNLMVSAVSKPVPASKALLPHR